MERADGNQPLPQWLRDGYCVVRDVLDKGILDVMRSASERLIAGQSEEEQRMHRSTGSMIPVTTDEAFAELVAWPGALHTLRSLGCPDPKFANGYVISKPPKSPRLFWHYDYALWDEPGSFEPMPKQIFLMYYLVDTTAANGCLRVIPGTHMEDNPLHDVLEEAHTQQLLQAADLSSPAFSTRPDEVDVQVRAGDLVIGDSRLLHASHANESEEHRTVITLWYTPDFAGLSEGAKAFYHHLRKMPGDDWSDGNRALLDSVRLRYEGTAGPLPWNRKRPARGKRQ